MRKYACVITLVVTSITIRVILEVPILTKLHRSSDGSRLNTDGDFGCQSARLEKTLRLYNKWYNIEGWHHPGGPAALKLAIGRDATTLFNMHHPFVSRSRLAASLAKRELTNAQASCLQVKQLIEWRDRNGSAFNWSGGVESMSRLRVDLVRGVGAHFDAEAARRGLSQVQAMKATPEWWATQCFVVALLLCVVRYSTIKGDLWSIPIVVALMWVTLGATIHDGSHFALSQHWVVNEVGTHIAPMMSASWAWKVQHCIGHHAHVNVPKRDPDLYHSAGLFRVHPSVNWKKAHSIQGHTFLLKWSVALLYLPLFRDLEDAHAFNNVASIDPRPAGPNWWIYEFARVTVVLALFCVVPHYTMRSHWRAFVVPILIWTGLSFTFMAFSQVSHLDEEAVKGYDPVDFWNHTIATTQDWACGSKFWGYVSIGLNCQVVHHLFPTVHPCHYPYIQPLIAHGLAQHGVAYRNAASWWHCFSSYHAWLEAMSQGNYSISLLSFFGDYVMKVINMADGIRKNIGFRWPLQRQQRQPQQMQQEDEGEKQQQDVHDKQRQQDNAEDDEKAKENETAAKTNAECVATPITIACQQPEPEYSPVTAGINKPSWVEHDSSLPNEGRQCLHFDMSSNSSSSSGEGVQEDEEVEPIKEAEEQASTEDAAGGSTAVKEVAKTGEESVVEVIVEGKKNEKDEKKEEDDDEDKGNGSGMVLTPAWHDMLQELKSELRNRGATKRADG